MTFDEDAFRRKLEERARENRRSFEGQYANTLKELLGLSREEIDRITPGTTDLESYDALITVVKVASARNASQAALRERIVQLGEVAVRIAERVPSLAGVL